MSVHVVILNWNDAAATGRCLESLRRASGPLPAIHVLDNGSTDGSAAEIERRHPEARIHRNGANLGYAGGVNPGIRIALAAGAEWVFLLNNDATVAADALPRLLEAAERRPECGLYTGKIFQDRAARRLWSCGVRLGWWPNLCRLRGYGRIDRGAFDREETMPLVTGCALLVHRRVFERIGLFDESYFLYVEDADFCARAVAAGFRPLYVPGAVFEHVGSGSTGGGYSPVRKYLNAHGAVTYLRRHGTPLLWAGFVLLDVLGWPLALLLGALRGRTAGALAKGRGLLHGILGRRQDVGPLLGRSVPGTR